MQIQTSWLLQKKPTYLDLHCLQRQSISGFSRTTVLLTSLGKTFFAWRFILNLNYHILAEIIFFFSVSVFGSEICTLTLNQRPKIGLAYAISTVEWFFGNFDSENSFHVSLQNLNYWCFATKMWTFQKNWANGTCWIFASKLPTLPVSA